MMAEGDKSEASPVAEVDTAKYLDEEVVQDVKYTTKDAILYAVAIGCTDPTFTFENTENFSVFPTFPLVFPVKGCDTDIEPFPSPTMLAGPQTPSLPGIELGVEGERSLEIFSKLPTGGAKLKMKSKIIGINRRGRGALVETETLIYDAKKNWPLARIVTGTIFIGAKGFKNCGTTNSEVIDFPHGPAQETVELTSAPNQALLYRLASGDYNPIHVSNLAASRAGYDRPMLHPHCVFGMLGRAVVEKYGHGDPTSLLNLKCRFLGTVYPGQVVVCEMWKLSSFEVVLKVFVKESGKVVVNASATVDPKGVADVVGKGTTRAVTSSL